MYPLAKIRDINTLCFLSSDTFSDLEVLKEYKVDPSFRIITLHKDRKLVGYILYTDLSTHLESLRVGVHPSSRGQGLGSILLKKLNKIADKKKKDIYTYVSKSNLVSLNLHTKCKYIITDISDDWVYIQYKHKNLKV